MRATPVIQGRYEAMETKQNKKTAESEMCCPFCLIDLPHCS